MDKAQALHQFWSSFGLPAYDETSVPSDAKMPYITYNIAMDNFDNVLSLSASIWYNSTSWEAITKKSEEIAERITEHGFVIKEIDNGYLWITRGSPFAQRMRDESSDSIRRMYILITVEYLTKW